MQVADSKIMFVDTEWPNNKGRVAAEGVTQLLGWRWIEPATAAMVDQVQGFTRRFP